MIPAAAQGAEPIDGAQFRRALGRFATGVALVTAMPRGRPDGLIVNSLTSVSLEPPLVAFCPARASLTWCRMRRARSFGINVLGAGWESFVRRVAPAGVDRLAGVDWTPTAAGIPAIAGAIAYVGCTIEDEHVAGDHWIVVGRVEELRVAEPQAPLVFWKGAYGTFD